MAGEKRGAASFPVVGIGASAGGLNALECFIGALPREFSFAIVFMQHLSTKHKSLLPGLLSARRPDLEICEVAERLRLLPGKIYLCPPGKAVGIGQGLFQVSAPAKDHFHLPIDEFFASLAEEAGERAIGVVFSGAGTDGARGIQAVRSAGGTVFVQDPSTAGFTGMPLAAIGTGRADGILPPEEIAREILKLGEGGPAASDTDLAPAEFETLYRLIREKTGHTFHHYKKTVVGRRIRRRMYLKGVSSVSEYLSLVAEKDSEADSVASDLMIGVTSFFRDRLAWKALGTGVIRKLAASDDDLPVRVWAPACATGEEAYSIAMLLRGEFDLAGRKREIQVFATDINEPALERAREGKYPASVAADVPPDYMKQFFTLEEDGLSAAVSKEVRESVVFARQDLLIDPPFSRLDLIICRNLLIYLEPAAQERCISLFHYALRDGGYLFLGNAETPGRRSALFKSLPHKKCRIYQRLATERPSRLALMAPFAPERLPTPFPRSAPESQKSLMEVVQQALLEEVGPAAVAVDQHCEILYLSGPTHRYLRQPRGAPSQNLLELLPDHLGNRVRGALYRAGAEAAAVTLQAAFPGENGKKMRTRIRVSKLKEALFLVVFFESRGASAKAEAPEPAGDDSAIRQLEGELSATRRELQSNIEQLRSLNEELQSSNEEFQAANEELETSREELQSLNEELITVNAQLQSKIEEQEETNNDLSNFLASTNIPTLFLDLQFRVKRFTPAMSRLLKLIPSDLGRSIADMSQEGLGPDLIADAGAVIDHLVPVRKEIEIGGAWYVRSALPYRTADNRIEGAVITYQDVSDLKRAEKLTIHLASFPRFNPNPVIEVDFSGTITFANPATKRLLQSEGMDKDDVEVFLPEDIAAILRNTGRQESSVYREVTVKDRVYGETVHVASEFGVVRIYAYEISGLKRAEGVARARLRMLETFYATDISPNDMLRMALDEIEAQTQSTIGFYHFVEADQETLSLQNWSTNTLQKMCTAEGKGSHYPVSQAGVWVDCVRERRPVIHNDYASLPHRKGLPHGHAPVVRQMVIPLMRGSRIVAVIGVGNKSFDYNAVDVEIASQLGDFSWELIERKRAEDALRVSGERSRSYIEVTGQLGWTTNAEGEVIEDLPSWREYTGKTYDEIKGWGWAESLHPDDVDHTVQEWNEAVKEKRTYEVEYRLRRHDGVYRHFLARGIPVLKEDGSVREWVGTCIDITDRKQTEQALRESEERLKRAQEIAHLGSWELDLLDNTLTWSDEVYRIFGMEPQEFGATYEAFLEAVHPDDRAAVDAAYSESIREGRDTYEMEHRVAQKSTGEVRYVHEKCEHFRDASGRIIRSGGMVHDITDRERTEEALRRSLGRFELLMATAGELLQSTEPQKVVESVCKKVMEHLDCHAFFNFLMDEDAGKLHLNAWAGIPEKEAKRIEWLDVGSAVCGCVAREGARIVAEHIPTTPDERTDSVKSYGIKAYCCHPLIGPGGMVIGTLSFGTCSRETFNEEDLSLMRAVADQVAVAVVRMRNESDVLALSEVMAARNVELETVNMELEFFIYSISHDLRAPLRSMAGFARILSDDYAGKLDSQGLEYLSRIQKSSVKMNRLMDDLLHLSKISRQEMERAEVDMSGKADALVAEMREADPGRTVDIEIQAGLVAHADPRLIGLVLSNLLGNAWKFTSKTAGARIEMGSVERDGETVYYVRDNGAGFNPDYAEKMFWPFQRLHSEGEFEGTGIGLTIVERIIQRHGGRVWAEGEKGKGSTIYFTLG